jgi:PRTRC genetic system ThiF family protein
MVVNWNILLVGCGGTGGFVAEGLCRLLIGHHVPIYLVDYDRVEAHNLMRQSFYPGDVGKFKSQALAERLTRQYGRTIRYCVAPFANDLIGHEWGGLQSQMSQGIIIGCVDDAPGRQAIASGFHSLSSWWIDAGNGRNSGQVLIGNADDKMQLCDSFDQVKHEVTMPLPSLQAPSLLIPTPARQPDCAQAVADEEQGPVINQAMGALVMTFVHKLLTRSLTWMGAYIDLDAGTLHAVPAEPAIVARMMGMEVDILTGASNKKEASHV